MHKKSLQRTGLFHFLISVWVQGRGKWAKIEGQVGVAGVTSWSDEVMVRSGLYLVCFVTCLSMLFLLVEVGYWQLCLDSFVLFSLINRYSSDCFGLLVFYVW